MIVLSVCNHKGGTGKTTTAIHLAAAMGLSGWRTLVVDLDPQGFLTRTMGIDEPAPEASVAALFSPDVKVGRLPVREASGFDLLPSSSTLTKRLRDLNKPTDVLWVREALQRAKLNYDLVLFDTAAAVTVFSLNAIVASQHVLIPVLPEYQAVVGAEQTFQTTTLVRDKLNPRLQSRTFLLTQVDARKRIHRTYQQYLREKYGERVLDNVIRTSTALAESRDGGTTVFDHDSSARGARDYANATDEMLRRLRAMESQEDVRATVTDESIDADDVPLPDEALDS
ncbi:ParA family protein [Salinibacter sp. 10B]|uniref:ParA family protein n=1 Tax=Salinibacter sp. 10B TaxID=1923971 RepID=UPI000CF4479F|nr:ParA family protein [Salinibacter sp. 10B]